MTKSITGSDLLNQERRNRISDKRHVLALEMIADQLSLIHSDLALIGKYFNGADPSHLASAKDVDRAAEDWENEGGHLRQADRRDGSGVTRSLVEIFSVGAYRYTDFAHAIAEAQRARRAGTAHE